MMMNLDALLATIMLLGLTSIASAGTNPTSVPAVQDNLGYWLGQAKPAAATSPAGNSAASQPAASLREDALPGAIELSDGFVLGGFLYTTRDSPFVVYLEQEKVYRRIPPIAVLSITAIIKDQTVEPQWRWKEMGAPERVYTGRQQPVRRLEWKFRLIDGSTVTGIVKSQPIWIEQDGKKLGPFILQERSQGSEGTNPADLGYIRKVVISRQAMEQVLAVPTENLIRIEKQGPRAWP
jgi:hypothetical protein